MGVIDSTFPKTSLDLEYNAAKIMASPCDYKLSERIFFESNGTCRDKYDIFTKSNRSEWDLCDLLKLCQAGYMELNPKLKITKVMNTSTEIFDFLEANAMCLGSIGTFITYNNLIVNEEILITDLGYSNNSTLYYTVDMVNIKNLESKTYLKALEVWYKKCTNEASLIPNLMYLATEFCDYSLEDIEDIKFATLAISKNEAPFIENYAGIYSDITNTNLMLSTCIVPFYKKNKFGYAPNMYKDIYVKFPKSLDIKTQLYKLGLCYSVIYGCEILYYLNKITDIALKYALEDLLAINYDDSSFCSKYLYKITPDSHIEINPDVLACFDDNNTVRFEKIKTYFNTLLTTSDFSDDIESNLDYYALPIFFARMITNMHAYAYQKARIKHAILLYKEAKSKGLLTKENFEKTLDSGGLFGIPGTSDDSDNELINLDDFSMSDDTTSTEDLLDKEKEVGKDSKERPPMLNAADMLKKDLHDSRYDYDIINVKSDPSNKNAYNKIANSITLITHNLTKQIKEIKTYNTGGKSGGLLVGKLDKKNLWKYKTDPHIFYNNNYKIKEMDLAFGCILDESGSMWGEKIKNGRIVMIMLHEVLNSLGINHSIIGHTSNGMYQSKIFKYFQFKEEAFYSLQKPYGLTKATSRDGNCDSGALYYMQSVMKNVKNKDKIVIIFSDGQPTECTDLDLTNQVKAMEKSGIHVIGVGINFPSIKEYYPDNANGKNLKEMVDIVISILKRYVLEKKED